MIEISVIIPVYNAEHYLCRCLDSVLSQSFCSFELILVDDGSTDRSGTICEHYAKKDKRVRVIHQSNQGQAAARNCGVAKAEGEWIAFVDADDVIHPQMLELLYCAVKESMSKISVCRICEDRIIPDNFNAAQTKKYIKHSVDEDSLIRWYFGNCRDEMDRFAYWVVWGKLIHRSIPIKIPFTEGMVYEDNALVFRWLYEAKTVAFCDNIMYFYFVNETGTTKGTYSIKKLDWLRALEEQLKFYKKTGFERLFKIISKRYILEAVREYKNITEFLKDKRTAKKLRRKITVFWIGNTKNINLSREEKMDLLTHMYPNQIHMLWKIKNAFINR